MRVVSSVYQCVLRIKSRTIQSIAFLVVCGVAYNQPGYVREQITTWLNTLNLIYVKEFLELIEANIEEYTSYSITFFSIYTAGCLFYMYGAYTYKNVLMIPYILLEAIRFLLLLLTLVLWLLVLKQNTMDIGLLIGASVVGGFGLLGVSYLWVCAASLPVVINEMDREEKLATINKLQKLLENSRPKYENFHFNDDVDGIYGTDLFVVPRNRITKSIPMAKINTQNSSYLN